MMTHTIFLLLRIACDVIYEEGLCHGRAQVFEATGTVVDAPIESSEDGEIREAEAPVESSDREAIVIPGLPPL
jgi:hypothetical protein